MAIDFPAAPASGTTHSAAGVVWRYDGTKWKADTAIVPGDITSITVATGMTGGGTSGDVIVGLQIPVAVANGGTGATTAPAALTSLGAAPAAALNNVGRNLIHNPLFNIQQRGAGGWTTHAAYTADRWALFVQGSTTVNVGVVSLSDADRVGIGDEAARYGLSITTTGSAVAGSYSYIGQAVENLPRLAGKTVTVSFYANADRSLKLGINILQNFGNGGSPSAAAWALATGLPVTIPGATFARYSVQITIPSMAGKTLGTNQNSSTQLAFWTSATSSQDALAGNIGVQTGLINIWGVQLEIGSTMTPLEKPDPQQDLAKCQRFYQGTYNFLYSGYNVAGQGTFLRMLFPVQMRAAPTITVTNNTNGNVSGFATGANVFSINCAGTATATGVMNYNFDYTLSADL